MTHTPEPEESEAWNPNSDEQSMAAHMRMTKCLAACAGIPTDKLTPGVVKRLIEACAEIAAGYDWLGERRAAGIGKIGSGYDEDTFAAGADHAAREIAARILRELGEP